MILSEYKKSDWLGQGVVVDGYSESLILGNKSAIFSFIDVYASEEIYVEFDARSDKKKSDIYFGVFDKEEKLVSKVSVNIPEGEMSRHAIKVTPKKRLDKCLFRIWRDDDIDTNTLMTNIRVAAPDEKINREDDGTETTAFIVPYGIYGGGEIYIQRIAQYMSKQEVRFIFLNNNPLAPWCRKNGYKIAAMPAKDLASFLTERNFSNVHFYNSKAVYNIIRLIKSRISSNIVETIHSTLEWADSMHDVGERTAVDKIILISENLKEILHENDKGKAMIINNGVDTERFSHLNDFVKFPFEEGGIKINSYPYIIGTVARLSNEKNLFKIIDVAKELPDMKFVIIGNGNQEQDLNKKISDDNLNNVFLVPHQLEIEKYYTRFDAFLLPSTMEGTPYTILEAMASKVPVVASNVGGIPTMIKDGETGFLVDPDSTESIVDAIKRAVALDSENVVSAAYKYVCDNYNERTFALKVIKQYKKRNPLVSVIMAAWNTEGFILDAINSVNNQTHDNWELIIVDDGSEDSTVALAKSAAQNNSKIKIVELSEHTGSVGHVKKIAVANSSGEFFVELDSDDMLEPNALDDLLEPFWAISNLGFVYSGFNLFGKASGDSDKFGNRTYDRNKILNINTAFAARMFKKIAYNATEGFDNSMTSAADYDLVLKVAEISGGYWLNKKLYNYRIHGNTQTSLGVNKSIQDLNAKKAVINSLKRMNIKAKVIGDRPPFKIE